MKTSGIKISSFPSPRTRCPVANQFIIQTNEGRFFQSYESIIVFKPNKVGEKIKLDINKWDYSRTTAKYRNEFLQEDTRETKRKIKNGEYILADLNS